MLLRVNMKRQSVFIRFAVQLTGTFYPTVSVSAKSSRPKMILIQKGASMSSCICTTHDLMANRSKTCFTLVYLAYLATAVHIYIPHENHRSSCSPISFKQPLITLYMYCSVGEKKPGVNKTCLGSIRDIIITIQMIMVYQMLDERETPVYYQDMAGCPNLPDIACKLESFKFKGRASFEMILLFF